ncbi:MAG TPA: single-stranded DNA-binding protein [Massilibacterium sp.]|nr:single-stranded DNA-binding protein [Massilibacterium sp.]
MINRVVLVGRLTKDPDLRFTANGIAVTRFTCAVNRTFTNAQGEREADFINIVVWRRQAENVANYCHKGMLVGIDGRIQTSSYENQEGRRVYVTEVVADSVQFLESKSQSQQSGMGTRNYGAAPQGQPQGNNPFSSGGGQNPQKENTRLGGDDPFLNDGQPIDISDDDLPF